MAVIIECQGSTPSNSSSMEMNFIDLFHGDPLVVYLSNGMAGQLRNGSCDMKTILELIGMRLIIVG